MSVKIIQGKNNCMASRCRQEPTDEVGGYQLCYRHAKEYAEEIGVEFSPAPAPEGGEGDKAQELQKAAEEFSAYLQGVQGYEIVNTETYQFCETLLAEVREQKAHYNQQKEGLCEEFAEAQKRIKKGLAKISRWFAPVEGALHSMERLLRDKLSNYRMEQERKAAELRRAAVEQPPEQVRETIVQAIATVPPESKFIAIDRWTFDITDESAIPREFLAPDMSKIGMVVTRDKEKTNIPGVAARKTQIMRQR
jgi:hypothetical protein